MAEYKEWSLATHLLNKQKNEKMKEKCSIKLRLALREGKIGRILRSLELHEQARGEWTITTTHREVIVSLMLRSCRIHNSHTKERCWPSNFFFNKIIFPRNIYHIYFKDDITHLARWHFFFSWKSLTEVPVNPYLYAFEQTTYNIQVVKTAVSTLCLTKCDPPPPSLKNPG